MFKISKLSIFQNWKRYLSLGILSALLTSIPVIAAEKLFLIYGPLKLSLRVSSLELFAKEGTINKDLEFYLGKANPEQQAKFREALTEKASVDPLLVSRFFNTEIGEDILQRIGKGFTIEGGRNGEYALRGALVQAALDPEEGLTLINFFEKLPVNIEFQGDLILEASKKFDLVILATKVFSEKIRDLTVEEVANNPPINFSTMSDLRQPGPYGFQKETWQLTDQSRNRKFYVDIYKPQQWREGKTPVVIASHGLASNPADFTEAGQHLASYGYVVAIPQHPGSDSKYAEDLRKGLVREVFDINEFINRPKDISYVIDELERRNQSQFQGRLNLESIGVAGHSFGGYTALAIAGAEIDWQNLKAECNREYGALNISLLLQCRALELPQEAYNLRDTRVKAVFAANPVNRAIFGQKGLSKISIPVMLAAGSYDPATPFIFEQGPTFPWLTTPDKYLAIVEGQAHVNFAHLDGQMKKAINSVNSLTLPSPQLIGNYARSLQTAFFEVYIANNAQMRPYLQSSYAQYLSQDEEFKLDLITGASSDQWEQVIAEFRQEQDIE
jgi:predicted dienelactone hydrolase